MTLVVSDEVSCLDGSVESLLRGFVAGFAFGFVYVDLFVPKNNVSLIHLKNHSCCNSPFSFSSLSSNFSCSSTVSYSSCFRFAALREFFSEKLHRKSSVTTKDAKTSGVYTQKIATVTDKKHFVRSTAFTPKKLGDYFLSFCTKKNLCFLKNFRVLKFAFKSAFVGASWSFIVSFTSCSLNRADVPYPINSAIAGGLAGAAISSALRVQRSTFLSNTFTSLALSVALQAMSFENLAESKSKKAKNYFG